MSRLRARHRAPEIMDQAGLDPAEHHQALTGLRRINRISGTARVLWQCVRRELDGSRTARVLDVGCGGGDLLIDLAQRAGRAAIRLEVAGLDLSPNAIELARAKARGLGLGRASFEVQDVLGPSLPEGYDVVMSSLFLHHFDDGASEELLRRMAAVARRRVLVDDLERSRPGLALAHVGCRLLSRSPIVHADGPRSVHAAFTVPELARLAERAELRNFSVRRRFPFRMLLSAAGAGPPA